MAADPNSVADEIGRACRDWGLFYVVGHGVETSLIEHLDALSRKFFSQDLSTKMRVRMQLGGRAWRGYFPIGQELTSGKPDQKEGLYFGSELPDTHTKVIAGTPLHGRNLFPDVSDTRSYRDTVLDYLDALTNVGHRLMAAMAMSLGLERNYFARRYTADPFILFRVFHYPALPAPSTRASSDELWSVGEHTDYGFLTILLQDDAGGLQVKSGGQWIDAPPVPGSFVCNIGDMLERITGGRYRSTPHRVRNTSNRGRLSFPFFFDPNFDAEIRPIEHNRTHKSTTDESRSEIRHGIEPDDRWDGANVHNIRGTYGDYVLDKVSKVFPELGRRSL